MKIGIPRALLYYWYGIRWERFWQICGCETVTSPLTERATINAGSAVAVDEICLPIKIFLGHVIRLAPLVDRIMIPHLVKVEPNAFICPKFMGLPDLVAHSVDPEVKKKTFSVQVGLRQMDQWQCLSEAAQQLGFKPKDLPKMPLNWLEEVSPAAQELQRLQENAESELTLGILGHPYCVYDACFNLDLLRLLTRNRVGFLTPEQMPPQAQGQGSRRLEKELFWTIGRRQLDALEWMLTGSEQRVQGFIQVTPFACGPEAIVGDLLERRIKETGLPLLKLNFEEHSGEAGVVTRLEAFLDLIKLRSRVH